MGLTVRNGLVNEAQEVMWRQNGKKNCDESEEERVRRLTRKRKRSESQKVATNLWSPQQDGQVRDSSSLRNDHILTFGVQNLTHF